MNGSRYLVNKILGAVNVGAKIQTSFALQVVHGVWPFCILSHMLVKVSMFVGAASARRRLLLSANS